MASVICGTQLCPPSVVLRIVPLRKPTTVAVIFIAEVNGIKQVGGVANLLDPVFRHRLSSG